MPDKKLTDAEIMKDISFEKKIKDFFSRYENKSGAEDCAEVCLIRAGYRTVLKAEEEINRQKAEIEKLQQILYAFLDTRNGDLVHITEKELEIIKKPIKANAIKEFAELLHCHCENRINNPINQKIQPLTWAAAYEEFEDVVDNLVKEMVGDSE